MTSETKIAPLKVYTCAEFLRTLFPTPNLSEDYGEFTMLALKRREPVRVGLLFGSSSTAEIAKAFIPDMVDRDLREKFLFAPAALYSVSVAVIDSTIEAVNPDFVFIDAAILEPNAKAEMLKRCYGGLQ